MTSQTDSQRLEHFQARLDVLQKEANFPGATAAFMLANGQTRGFATGYADKENKIAMTPNTKMLSGSIGKTFVAAVVLSLVQEGKLHLDDRLEKWCGEQVWYDRLPNAKDITLRMLLNHTSGLNNHNRDERFNQAIRQHFASDNPNRDFCFSPQELVELVLDKESLFPAGEGFSYSNTGYILIGMIIEQVSGTTYYEELSKRFLTPLNLSLTGPANSRNISGLSVGYLSPSNHLGLPEKNMLNGVLVFNPAVEWTDGGLFTNPQDLVRWAKVLYEGTAMKNLYLNDLLTSVPRDAAEKTRYGLGVTITETEFGITYGHNGWTPGYQSILAYFRENKVAIAMQVNSVENQDMVTYLKAIAEVVL